MCFHYLQVAESLLQLLLGAGTDEMAEYVLEVVDQDLSPICLQLIGQSPNESRASSTRLSCQVGQKHLEGPLSAQVCRKGVSSATNAFVCVSTCT